MAKTDELVIGVIGGLGPEATLDFFGKVLAHSKAKSDQEHLHVIIENNPKVPNRNDAIAGRGPSPGPALAAMAQALERAGADFIVMACNTAHAFEPEIRAATGKPFVSMIGEVVSELRRQHAGVRRVGLLAAQGCLDSSIYHGALQRQGFEPLQLDTASQAQFMHLLYRIKSGDRAAEVQSAMRGLGERLAAAGAEVIIAACTEVPLVLKAGDLSRPLLDSTDIMARRCVAYARRIEPLPNPSGDETP